MLFILIFHSLTASSQTQYFTSRPIYCDLLKEYIYVHSPKDSSIITNRGDKDSHYFKVFNLTPKGAFYFVLLDTVTQMMVKGQYRAASQLSKPFNYKRDGLRVITWDSGIDSYHYRPKRTGIWVYYNREGQLITKEAYQ